jgi:Ca2+-binding RTX toxin-like protein
MPFRQDEPVRTPPQTVTSPASLGDGNFNVTNAEANASITLGNGNSTVVETAAGASITVGNGNDRIFDSGGSATVQGGTGDMQVRLAGTGNKVTLAGNAGGAQDLTTVVAGQGSSTVAVGAGNAIAVAGGGGNTISLGAGLGAVEVGGSGNTVTTGSGTHLVVADGWPTAVTKDTINLGAGSNLVFLGGSGNTVNDGSGTDTIVGARAGSDTFVANAAGGTDTIYGFSLTNGDVLDLSQVLAGAGVASDLSNLGSFVTAASVTDAWNSRWTDTVLTVKGAAATATLTLVNSGTVAVADLVSHKAVLG